MKTKRCSNRQFAERAYTRNEEACKNCVLHTTDSKKFFSTQCPRTEDGQLLCETPNTGRFLVRQ